MDFQKTFLYIGLAIVSYLLFIQWQNDYGSNSGKVEVTTQDSADLSSREVDVSRIADEIPSAQENAIQSIDAAMDDLPSASPLAEAVNTAVVNTGNIIEVSTNLLELHINKQGGDIEYAALKKYPIDVENQDTPFILLEKNQRVQIAQSGLIGQDGIDKTVKGRPLYQSAQTNYQMTGDQILNVDLTYSKDSVNYTKRYTFEPNNYTIKVSHLIDNESSKVWKGQMFGQLKRDNSPDKTAKQGFMPLPTYLGAAYSTKPNTFEKLKFKDFSEEPLNTINQGGWVALVQHYFVNAWVPRSDQENVLSSRVVNQGKHYVITYKSPSQEIAPNQTGEFSGSLYVGPKDQHQLETLSPGLERTVDYGWLWFLAKPLFRVLEILYGFVNNWGIAIILLTVLIRLLLYPLAAKGYRSMANMRKFAPKLQQIREKYKSEPQKLSKEMMELYRKEGINPVGGCLPMLLQMPVFLALYWVLLESVELRQASFLWMQDLSLLDPLYLLPILMGASMFVQMQLNPRVSQDPMQEKVMKYLPLIFTVFFLWFPAGLVLYWLTNNLLSMAQQWWINKSVGV